MWTIFYNHITSTLVTYYICNFIFYLYIFKILFCLINRLL